MALLVYACRLDVPGDSAWADKVLPAYESWVKDRFRKAFQSEVGLDINGGAIVGALPPKHSINIRHFKTGGHAVELDWTYPSDNGLLWRNLIRLARLDDRCAMEHRVEIASAEYLVAPARYSVGAPGVVRRICRDDVFVGDMRVRSVVYPLPEGGVDQFVALLEAEQRRLPVVLITPFANGDRSEVQARTLADRLAGVAIVAEADSPQTTRLLSERLGRLGCYDGGIRIYWPGFQSADDLHLHPLLLGARIAIGGPDRALRTLERLIYPVAAFRFVPDPRIVAVVSASEASARAERAQEAVQEGGSTWEQYALEMSEKLDSALADLVALRAENENLRANQNVLFYGTEEAEGEDQTEAEATERTPRDVREAVDFAASDFGHLMFLDDSRGSADASPFKRPSEVYEALAMMNKVAGVWARNPGSGDLRLMLRDEGLGKRVSNFISQTSKGKWASDYTFNYDGKPQIFEWHVTLGAGSADTCASIHFMPDPTAGKLIVAHVGRHLTNTKS